MPNVIITREMKFALAMLRDPSEQMELINAMINMADGKPVERDQLYETVNVALDYILEKAESEPHYILYFDDGRSRE